MTDAVYDEYLCSHSQIYVVYTQGGPITICSPNYASLIIKIFRNFK